MRFGFVIDHSRCIGCHACSVACKEENQVPLGVYRTWVKYIEKGSFPDVRRNFAVLRCNHCDNAPCVTVCPTEALFRRDNGIVDFDNQQCIGCKACMQACPYDAIYIDPGTQTAAKCNFCAHRVDQGLKPSCEVVCPEQAILSGDLDNPNSRIARFVARETVTVRKPEQGTRPKLFYKDVDDHAVDPLASARGGGYQFATEQFGFGRDRVLGAVQPEAERGYEDVWKKLWNESHEKARTTYDVVHHRPWGAMVSGYIFTKSIAAGAVLAFALGRLFAVWENATPLATASGVLSLLFLGITSVLLIADLKQPLRFWKILVRPQWRSWLAIGSFVLMGFGALAFAWLAARLLGAPDGLQNLLLGAAAAAAIPAAIYTGFLFSQMEGRDYWQNPVLPVHLFVQALLAGSAGLLLLAPAVVRDAGAACEFLRVVLGAALVLDLFIVGFGEWGMRHGTKDAAASSRWMTHGPARLLFWVGVLLVGHVLPVALLLGGLGTLSAVLALAGLLLFEHLWILAGQSQPLS